MESKKDLQSFYYGLLNIRGNKNSLNTIDGIVFKNKEEISAVSGDLDGLCKVIANNISVELTEHNISHRILNTYDLFNCYEHHFIISYYNEDGMLKYILIDPSYIQFLPKHNHHLISSFTEWPSSVLGKTEKGARMLKNILQKGYCEIDCENINLYLGSFQNETDVFKIDFKLEDILLDNVDSKKSSL